MHVGTFPRVNRKLFLPLSICLAVPLIVTCTNIVEPALPSDAEVFSPPPVYSTWWQMTQVCSAINGSLASLTWYKTDQVVHDTQSGDVIAGYYVRGSNRIVLTATVMTNGGIVRHEMLHALLKRAGHPRAQFLGSCAGTVDCEGPCAADAEPYQAPPQSPISVPGDSIEITLAVEPQTPTRSVDEGRFTLTVFARNRTARWIAIAPTAGADAEQTFSFGVDGVNGATGGDRRASDPSYKIFAPGETKRQVFDLRIGDYPFGNQLLPGDYLAHGAFAGWRSGDSAFVISP